MTIYKPLQLLSRRLRCRIHCTEDYIVYKAFIAAAEDPIVLRKTMFEKYKKLLLQQVYLDSLKYSSATADAWLLIPELNIYDV
jgi:hypothetical protein